jgi:hypothetical protein
MQCPACNHEADEAEYGEPARCPACGVFYEKALALKNRRLAAEAAAAEAAKPQTKPASKLAKGWNGAMVSVEEGRRQREAEQQRNLASRAASEAKPVVVIDIRMSFWSMVWFMVKWAIASIPALIILAVIGSVVFGIFIGLSGPYSPSRF